jgi:RNA polymerase sigma-70 factor (ECF subfamily)
MEPDEEATAVPEQARDRFAQEVAAELDGLFRLARALSGDESTAWDLVEDTVVRALERRSQFRGESSLRAWLRQILRHLAIDRARHHAHEVAVGDVEALWRDETYSVDPASVLDAAEERASLRDALVHLPSGYRSVVVLHDEEGWTSRAIAEALGISEPAVKQRLRRGRMMLVSVLGQESKRRRANRGVPLGCAEARQEVSAYLDGELSAERAAMLEAHLGGCATCPPLYQALVGVRDSLGALRDPDSVVPTALAERVRQRLEGRA